MQHFRKLEKHVCRAFILTGLVVAAAVNILAQTGELRGRVFMQQPDVSKEPLAGAQIDVFRVDLPARYSARTDQQGNFVFAGLPFVGKFVVAASHPMAKPNFVADVRLGSGAPVEIVLTPGDGKRLTLDEITAGDAPQGTNSPQNSTSEEIARKNAEIDAANKKITEANETVSRTFAAGNQALGAAAATSKSGASAEAIRQYTLAISQYDEGLAADADQPAILTNKAVALKSRGVERFNMAVGSKTYNDGEKTEALAAAKNDFRLAAQVAGNAVAMLKSQTVPTDAADLDRYNKNKYAALLTWAESMRLFVSKADPTQADAGAAAFRDYIAIEPDPAKRAKAHLDMAQMLLDAGEAEPALAEFRAILKTEPNNPRANLGAGLAVYSLGDRGPFKEAVTYLQHFVDVAPDSDPMKADAKAVLTELRSTQDLPPTKPKRR
jgi:tetratricopeptide (TPR) repeat protein